MTTSDLYEAAYLVTLGVPVIHIDNSNPRRFVFHFPAEAFDLQTEYRLGGRPVPARHFVDTVYELKRAMRRAEGAK